jgi:hypothetical protein
MHKSVMVLPSPRRPFLVLRLAAIPVLLALLVWMEARHPLPSFRLFTFFFVFLLAADLVSLLSGRARDGLIVLASLSMGLCVLEGIAIVLEPKIMMTVTDGWSVRRPVLGFGPEHAGRFHAEKRDPKTGSEIYLADYTIDANLLRQTISSEKGPAFVFFGDSFTFGLGVNDSDTLPQIFADLLDHKQRVLNLGFGGYGPQQVLREMETDLFDHLIGAQPWLFVFMTFAGHAERTACKPCWLRLGPHYVIENGRITFKGPCYEGPSLWLREWLENTAAYRVFIAPYRQRIGHDDIELYIRTMVAAVQLAKAKYGVPTLIPYIRTSSNYFEGTGFSDDAIIARLRDGGATIIDASLAEEQAQGALISIPGDGHPTPLANRLRASIIIDYIEHHMPEILLAGLQ